MATAEEGAEPPRRPRRSARLPIDAALVALATGLIEVFVVVAIAWNHWPDVIPQWLDRFVFTHGNVAIYWLPGAALVLLVLSLVFRLRVMWRQLLFLLAAVLSAALIICIMLVSQRSSSNPGIREPTCEDHLGQLGGIWLLARRERELLPYSGSMMFIDFRQRHWIQRGDEEYLLCPNDPSVVRLDSRGASDAYDHIQPDDHQAIRAHCSYAARDFERFPLSTDAAEPQVIASDAPNEAGVVETHVGGLYVLFDDGVVRFLDREALGLSPDADITIGPDSHSKLLRPLVVATSPR